MPGEVFWWINGKLIIFMKKFLDSDELKEMHFKEKVRKRDMVLLQIFFSFGFLNSDFPKIAFPRQNMSEKHSHDFPLVILNISALVKTSPFGTGKILIMLLRFNSKLYSKSRGVASP